MPEQNHAFLTITTDEPEMVQDVLDALNRSGTANVKTIYSPQPERAVTEKDSPWANYDRNVTLPMTAEVAKEFMDDKGFVTVIVEIDRYSYLNGYLNYANLADDDQWDRLHALAFDFGHPEECDDTILGVTTNGFVIAYTTCLKAALNEDE